MRTSAAGLLFCGAMCWFLPSRAGEALPEAPARPSVQRTENRAAEAAPRIEVFFAPHQRVLLSSEVSARLREVRREFGAIFEAGDLLVLLDPTRYEVRRDIAQAELRAARSACEATEALHKRGNASRVELEEARREEAVAAARLKLAEEDLRACEVRAPFSGRVVKVLAREHELAERGSPLLEIIDDTSLQAQFLVPAADFGDYRLGDAVAIRLEDGRQTVRGTVSHLGAEIHAASRTYEVRAEVPNPERRLRAGMSGVLVPASAKDPGDERE